MSRGMLSAPARSEGREGRATEHLKIQKPVAISPELMAGGALLALASVPLIGPLGILAFFGLTGGLLAFRPGYNLRQLVYFSPLLLLPLLAVVSTIWSMAPSNSMKAGLEFLITVIAAIMVCRNLRPERMILVLFIAFLTFIALALPYMAGAIATKQALAIPLFGSKNQTGTIGFMVFILSLAIMADRNQPVIARLVAIGALPVGLAVGWLAQSGGTTSSIVLSLMIFPPLAILAAFKLPTRLVLIALALLMVAIAIFFINDIVQAINDFRVNVLKKDATLTGRTYLWDFANRMSASRPWLGYGYVAFWRRGNIDAEGLWRWGGIGSRGGFNFHNQFIELKVDLGLVGMSIMIVTCAVIAVIGLARQISKPSMPLACLIAIMAVNYVRSYVEDGLVAPFSLMTTMWFAVALYSFPLTIGQSIRFAAGSNRTSAKPKSAKPAPIPRAPRVPLATRGVRGGNRTGVSLRTRY